MSDFEVRGDVLVRYRGLEKEITVPVGIREIAEGAFSNCQFAEQIYLPEGLKKIGDHAFGGCRALKAISLPDSVAEIGEYTFQYCDDLKDVKFPKGLTHMGSGVFRHCRSLEELTVPETLVKAGYECFYGCVKLEKIVLHGSDFGRSMLDGCFRLVFVDGPLAALERLDRDMADIVCMEYSRRCNDGIYSQQAHDAYAAFLTDVSVGIMKYIAENDDVKALYYFVEHSAISEASADAFIALAQQHDAFRVVSTLMEYRNSHFGEDGLDLIDQNFEL